MSCNFLIGSNAVLAILSLWVLSTSFGAERGSVHWNRDNKILYDHVELFPFVRKSWAELWNGTIFKQIWEGPSIYHVTTNVKLFRGKGCSISFPIGKDRASAYIIAWG